jgi:acetoacetyl-CoA synthetase
MSTQTPAKLWSPTKEFIEKSNLNNYQKWLEEKLDIRFDSYDSLWQWSVVNSDLFWETILQYFDVSYSGNYSKVTNGLGMPHTRWFEGISLNYAEHILRDKNDNEVAIFFQKEGKHVETCTWEELKQQVASFSIFLKSVGVGKGDRVVAYIPNIPEATIAFLATCSLGAVWSSCSPDFGASSVIDRFLQIEPKIFIAVNGYVYNGKSFDKSEVVQEIAEALNTVKCIVSIDYLSELPKIPNTINWQETVSDQSANLSFERVPFNDPIWVLYSSGTTGDPKAITHSQGGVLLEHLKYVSFHNDVKKGERYFWFTTTGWMMWNFVQATMLAGASIVLYDGSPGYPDMKSLWQMCADLKINHFGTSAPFILACLKRELDLSELDFSALRSISSTGSPLPPDGFSWIYAHVKKDLWFCSMSGGTDVCSAFVGGCPSESVFEGEIQRRALGCALFVYDDLGNRLEQGVGEMVIEKPMPSMPIYFWNDTDDIKYLDSYFSQFAGVWRHGDWIEITSRNTLIISGRSDATLNRHGIRIGSAEIYQAVDKVLEVKESLVVNLELKNGEHFMPLFLVLQEGISLDEQLITRIKNQIRSDYTTRHVPDDMVVVQDIPLTISGKKMESAVKKILMGRAINDSANEGAMRNPNSLKFFQEYFEDISQK